MTDKTINVFSLIISATSLITTIFIAFRTNKITKNQGKESTALSKLNNKLTEKIRESVEYLAPAQIDFKISNIEHPMNSISHIDLTIDDYLFGTTLKIQSDLKKYHGQIIKNYIFYKKYNGDIFKKSFEKTIKIDLCNKSKEKLIYIHSHFFVIYIDSAFKIHRIFVEIIAEATTGSLGNKSMSKIFIPTGRETHQELGQKMGKVLYRTFDELDLVENSYKEINNKNWKNGYTNRKEALNQEELNDLEKQKFNSSEIMEEIKEINKTFNVLGFN